MSLNICLRLTIDAFNLFEPDLVLILNEQFGHQFQIGKHHNRMKKMPFNNEVEFLSIFQIECPQVLVILSIAFFFPAFEFIALNSFRIPIFLQARKFESLILYYCVLFHLFQECFELWIVFFSAKSSGNILTHPKEAVL